MSKYTAEQVEDYAQACALIHKGPVIAEMLRDYAVLLQERESTKAAVTDEMIERAARAMCRKFDLPSSLDEMATCDKWRRFADEARCCLEVVASMLASAKQPIPMILHCPSCHTQHIDAPETTMQRYHAADIGEPLTIWNNPPHRSHLCHKCGTIWRPADVPTVGVEKIQTEGKHDVMMPAPVLTSARVPDGWMLVPKMFGIPADAWHAAQFAFGGPGTGDDEPFMDCTAWIGELTGDEGEKIHGLHIWCDECPEEGSMTLAEFPAAPKPETEE